MSAASARLGPGAKLTLGLVCAAVGATLLLRLGGNDIWFHVRAGQWIAEHGAVPTTDPFAHTSPGPWRYTEALAQLIYAAAHALAGARGLVLLHALLAALIAGAVAWIAEGRLGARALAVGLVGAASHAAMTPKPPHFCYLCFAALLGWLRHADRRERPIRALIFVPLLFVAWANLHRAGTLGLAVLGAAVVAWALRPPRRADAGKLAGLMALSAAALTLSSGGLYYLTSTFDVATRSSFAARLAEWQPATWSGLVERHAAALPLLALALAGRVERRDGRLRLRPVDAELLVLLGTAALAARSLRLLPFAAIAAAPAASRALDAAFDWLRARARGALRPSVLDAAGIALALAVLGARFTLQVPPSYWGLGVLEGRVPTGLAAQLREAPPPGRMFNAFDLGGYLLFALAPAQPVFIDGRNDTVYDDAFFGETLDAETSPAAFRRLAAAHDVTWAVVPWSGPNDPRFAYLHADPAWVLVHWDDAGAVLVRREPATEAYLAEHGYRELSLHDAFPRVARLGDGPSDRRLAHEVEQAAARAPRALRVAYLEALLHRRRGDREGYLGARRRLLELAAERGVDVRPP